MKLLLCVMTLVTLLASSGSAQDLETTIKLPDTLGPLDGPYHLAWDDNPAHPRLYVGGEGDSGGVVVAEAITCERLARIRTGPVKALCFVPSHGKLYVARSGADSVAVVDCATNQITSTIYTADTVPVMQYGSQNDRLYCGGDHVTVIDCAGDSAIHTIAVAAAAFVYGSSSNKLYAGGNGPLTVIDCARDTVVASIPEVDSARALCYNPTADKVYAKSGDTLFAVSTSGSGIVARLPLAGLAPLLTCDPRRNRVYCTHGYYWSSVDCARDSVILTSFMGDTASLMACDVTRDRLSIAIIARAPDFDVFDASTGQRLTYVRPDGIPSGWSWCPSLDRLYCLPCIWSDPAEQFCVLTAVSGAGDSIAGIVPLTMYAREVSIDSVNNRLYFAYPSTGPSCVGIVDCTRNIVTSYKHAGKSVGPMCYNPNNNRLYWSAMEYTGGIVTVFDCAGDSIVKRIPVIGGVQACQLNVGLNKLFVEAFDDSLCRDAIYVIDCGRDSVKSRILLSDDVLKKLILVPEDNTLWYLGVYHVVVIDCIGDSVIADAPDTLGSIDDACACPQERKIYTWDGRVIDMDAPKHIDTLSFGGNRFCYVPNARKLYACSNEFYPYVKVLDTKRDTVTARFGCSNMVSGMCLDHTGDYVYCAGYDDSVVTVIDTRKDTFVAEVRVSTYAAPREPLAANRKTNRIYEAQADQYHGNGIPVIRDSMLVGLEETKPKSRLSGVGPTVVRRGTPMRVHATSELWDATGRRALVLRPGPNDIRHLAPGVYFVRENQAQAQAQAEAVRKVIVTR